MFTKPSPINQKLEDEIVRVLDQMKTHDPRSAEYTDLGKQLTALNALRPEPKPKQLSPDTMLVVAANLAGIIWVTAVERDHPITSKTFSWILKPH